MCTVLPAIVTHKSFVNILGNIHHVGPLVYAWRAYMDHMNHKCRVGGGQVPEVVRHSNEVAGKCCNFSVGMVLFCDVCQLAVEA